MVGVIFDFNGTLFKDSDKHEAAWQVFSELHTGQTLTSPDYAKHVHGRNNKLILNYFFGDNLTPIQIKAYALEKEYIYRELCRADPWSLRLVYGATAYFDWLKQARIPHTIATAASEENLDFYFETFHLGQWFDRGKIIFDDGTLRSKPDPDPYLKASEMIQVPIQDVTVFEDSASGIQSAYAAGVKQIIGITTDGNQTDLCAEPGVCHVIDDYTDDMAKRLVMVTESM